MKALKRHLSLLLCVAMLLTVVLTAVACGKSDTPADTTTAATTTSDTTTAATETTTTAPEVDPYEPEQENFGKANGDPSDFYMLVRENRYGYLFDDGPPPSASIPLLISAI